MKPGHVEITIIRQPGNSLNFIILLILYNVKLRMSYISRVLNFAIFKKSRNLVLAKLNEKTAVANPGEGPGGARAPT